MSPFKQIAELQTRGVKSYVAGEMDAATKAWVEAMSVQADEIRKRKLPTDVRYLKGESWTNGFGHIALLDFFVKRRALKLDDRKYIVWARPPYIANEFYLNLWVPFLEIRSEARHADALLMQDFPMVLQLGGVWLPFMDAHALVIERWTREGRAPVLQLQPDIVMKGQRALEQMGIPSGAWFAALHVRVNGFASGTIDRPSIRNVSLDDYEKAVERVSEAGGYVVRVGAGSAPWFDVFALAHARFFIGCNSGPCWVAGTFGTPALLTNWASKSVRYPYPNSVTLKKKPVTDIEDLDLLEKCGIRPLANSPEEIEAATVDFIRNTA
jgi:hypothetical protein